MNRRTFFESTAVIGVAAVLSPRDAASLVQHPFTTIQAFNQQFHGYSAGEHVGRGDYVIFFTGFKSSPERADFYGQWLAYPNRDRVDRSSFRYFFAGVPGEAGEYWPGSQFNLRIQPDQIAISAGLFLTEQGRTDVLDAIAAGRTRLLRVLEDAGVL